MKRSRKNLIITLAVTFLLMALLVVFTSKVVFQTAFSSVQELGDEKAAAITADLENYLNTAKSVLWLAADTVDHMVDKGATNEEIIEYITRESSRTEQQFDESYTGLYGVIRGNYVDGVGWVPPEDYDPTKRDWYITTVAGKGEVTIVPPYVDAQTGSVIISVGKALTDNSNAMALDLTLDGVQEIVEKIRINGYGYGFIVDQDGMIIAHNDKNEKGKNYKEDSGKSELIEKVRSVGKGNFDFNIDGEKCTVFVDKVLDQWQLVIVTKNSELYSAPTYLLISSILINLVVFILISVFYILTYRSERKFNKRMEEMKEIERKKDYEARVLKLEKDSADSANKAKSNFLADMSHEIRTPINAILGMNEMILHESREDSTVEYASNIKSAGNTLLSIINSILDFSKIEDGRMHLVPVEFDTTVLISGLVNSITERAKSKNLELRVEVDESLPSRLLGDDVRISQVIMNILTNAVKYTEKGYILFSVKNLGVEDGLARLLVSVKDTGTGIRKEDIDRLSISFERLDEQKNRHIEGTGLGISIVTRLLEMMGSELKIESEYGVGSNFYFELPVEAVDITPIGKYDHSSSTSVAAEQKIGLHAPSARILLTDDNEMNRKVAANLLKLFGIKPVLCSSGEETIECMKKQEFDILFLDHMMPGMDGLDTLEALYEGSLVGNTKVIALTANAVVGAKEMYLEAGFDDYLAKPIQLPELEAILRKYLPEKTLAELAPDQKKTGERTPVERKSVVRTTTETVSHNDSGEYEIMDFAPVQDGYDLDESHDEAEGILDSDEAKESYFAGLRGIGLAVNEGLNYCGGDRDFYIEIVHDYIDAAPGRIKDLDRYLKEDRIKDYGILVHSTKSASKTIGAMSLYEKTRELEQAAAEGDVNKLHAEHNSVMNEIRDLVNKLSNVER